MNERKIIIAGDFNEDYSIFESVLSKAINNNGIEVSAIMVKENSDIEINAVMFGNAKNIPVISYNSESEILSANIVFVFNGTKKNITDNIMELCSKCEIYFSYSSDTKRINQLNQLMLEF